MRHTSMGWMLLAAALLAATADGGVRKPGWKPPAYHKLFTDEERAKPYVQARSHDLQFWPFLDGQWEGIVTDSAGNVWFSVSTDHDYEHAQLFRYDAKNDRVNHIADVGQVCGEKLTGNPPQDKIHGQMFEWGDSILTGTCEGHAIRGNPYKGGYWLKIDKRTGEVTNMGKTQTNDGLLNVDWDPWRKILYGMTNRTGELVRFDPTSGRETILGVPQQDYIDAWKASTDPKKPKEIWPRSLTLMVAPNGKVYGDKRPACTIWEYDPPTGKIRNIEVDMPLPEKVAAGDAKAVARWKSGGLHMTLWDEHDQCFYAIRSADEMLIRFYPPTYDQAGKERKKARVETVQAMGVGGPYPSCALVMMDRTLWYTPYTGWGGRTSLQSYNLGTGTFTDHGPIVVEGDRRVNECHSTAAGKDGKLYLVAFVFSKEGTADPVYPWAMRHKYPFHPRFVIIDPAKDCTRPVRDRPPVRPQRPDARDQEAL